jgi:hypothetical protein
MSGPGDHGVLSAIGHGVLSPGTAADETATAVEAATPVAREAVASTAATANHSRGVVGPRVSDLMVFLRASVHRIDGRG